MANPPLPERHLWIDAAKGAAITLVVVHHAFLVVGRSGLPSGLHGKVDALLEPPVMATFFLASALLTAPRLSLSWRRFFGRKLLPLIWFFAVWSMLLGLLNGWSPFAPPLAPDGILGFVAEAVFRPQNGMWFVWLLIVFTVAARMVRALSPATMLMGAVALAALHAAGLIGRSPGPFSWLVVSNTFQFAPAFFLGICLPALFHRLAAAPAQAAAACAACLAALGLLAGVDVALHGHLSGATAAWRGLIGGPAGVLAAILVCRSDRAGRALAWIGRRSFSIFVGHGVVLLPLAPVVARAVAPVARPMGEAGATLTACLMAAVAIAGALVFVRCLVALRLVWLYAPPIEVARRAARRLLPDGA